jgi:hypothetical protein
MNLPKQIDIIDYKKEKLNTPERGTDDFWNDCEE